MLWRTSIFPPAALPAGEALELALALALAPVSELDEAVASDDPSVVVVLVLSVDAVSDTTVVVVDASAEVSVLVVSEVEVVASLSDAVVVSVSTAVLVVEAEAEAEFVLLDCAASPFSTRIQFAISGWPRLAASAKAAMSNPILADVSAGGKKDENLSGIAKSAGCKYARNVYL